MDPVTIMSILVLAGFIGAGADLATGGLVRAELGGVRGAGSYVRTAGSRRVREARAAARRERMRTPMGRAVQFVLDEVGAMGWGLVRGWRSGRTAARTAWRERLGDQSMPIVRICRDAAESARTWAERRANGDPKGASVDPERDPNGAAPEHPNGAGQDPNGESEQDPERAWWDPNGITADPFLGGPERDPNGHPDDDPLPPRCPDCGMALVISSLTDHRLGRDRCPYVDMEDDPNDTPNGTPELPTQPARTEGPTTVTDINSAPAALSLFEAFRGRFEEPESLLAALHDEIAAAADSMGDFAIGGEGDLTAGLQVAVEGVVQARETLDGYLSSLHLEYDASIEAAAGKAANAHSVMQEV